MEGKQVAVAAVLAGLCEIPRRAGCSEPDLAAWLADLGFAGAALPALPPAEQELVRGLYARFPGWGTVGPAPLQSVFSIIRLAGPGDSPPAWVVPDAPPERIACPVSAAPVLDAALYRGLTDRLAADLRALGGQATSATLLLLAEKWTAGAPANPGAAGATVALYDAIRTVAALAACLAAGRGPAGEELLLVGADFSGVQDFIYTLKKEGALANLRARSFYLELYTEHLVARLMEQLGLSRANLIFNGGGRFYLLAPRLPAAVAALEALRAEVNRDLYAEHGLALYLALAWQPVGLETLLAAGGALPFCRAWELLGAKLAERKLRKYGETIAGAGAAFFAPAGGGRETCGVCRRELPDGELAPVCGVCRRLNTVGEALPATKYVVRAPAAGADEAALIIGGHAYHFRRTAAELASVRDPQLVYVVNSLDPADYRDLNAVPLYLGAYPNRSVSFEELAETAIGRERLGVLRMDVDNLGRVFTQGLPEAERTLAGISALSRLLTKFFKYHLNGICAGELGGRTPLSLLPGRAARPRDVMIVYAGGDDLFVIGAWNDVCELAFDVRETFTAWAGGNPDLTISAGVVVIGAGWPFYKSAELAGEAEAAAKGHGRDCVTLFGESVKWERMKELLANVADNLVRVGDLPRGFVYKLFVITELWQREGKMSLPHLAYLFGRTQSQYRLDQNPHWHRLRDTLMTQDYLAELAAPLRWVSLLESPAASGGGTRRSSDG